MKRVQEVFLNDNFFWFLATRHIFTNSPTYFDNLKYWIDKANNRLQYHKINYITRALQLFHFYYSEFSVLHPFFLPSY
jgi:hypothetical protein